MTKIIKDEQGGFPLSFPATLLLLGIIAVAGVMLRTPGDGKGIRSAWSGSGGSSCASKMVGAGFQKPGCRTGFKGIRSDSIVFLKAK